MNTSSTVSKTTRSSDFTIAKGVPIWAIVGGIAVIGGVAVLATGGSTEPSGSPDDPGGTSNIPDPLKPGGS